MTKDAQNYIDQIMTASAPDQMSKKEALEFLEEIGSAIDGSVDALREEMSDEEE